MEEEDKYTEEEEDNTDSDDYEEDEEEKKKRYSEEIKKGLKEQYPQEKGQDIKKRIEEFAQKRKDQEELEQRQKEKEDYEQVMKQRTIPGLEPEEKEKIDQRITKQKVDEQDIKERDQKLIQQQRTLERRRAAERLRAMEQQPTSLALLGTQVGGYLGFTREGIVGKKMAEEKLKTQTQRVKAYDENLKILREQKAEKEKEIKEYKKKNETYAPVINEKLQGMGELMKKIEHYQQRSEKEKDVLEKLKQQRMHETKFIEPKLTPRKGKQPKAPKRIGVPKMAKTFGIRFERMIDRLEVGPQAAKYEKMALGVPLKTRQKTAIEQTNDEITETNGLTKPTPTQPKNEYGVEDWIMRI